MTTPSSVWRNREINAHSPEAVAFIPECVVTNNRQQRDTRTDMWLGEERDSLEVGCLPRAKMRGRNAGGDWQA